MPDRSPPPGRRGRVLFVVTELGYGGAEVQVVELALSLQRRGWSPMVVSLMPPIGLTERLDAAGIPVETVRAAKGRPDPRLVVRLARIIRRFKPDVVHTHTLPANFVGRAARLLARPPVLVTSAHNVDEGGPLRMLAYRLTDRLSDLTTNVSRVAVDRYVALKAAPAHRIRHMVNGIDLSRFSPDPARRSATRQALGVDDDAFVWLAVGRLMPQKDYPNLLTALERVAAARPGLRLLVAGVGVELPALQAHVARAALPVTFLGLREDAPDLMRAADAFVMSSSFEGLPIVLLEAAATALPIVATDVGGNAEVVVDGVNGTIVPPSDPGALAEAMIALMSRSPEERAALGAASREHARSVFALDAVVDRWEAIYAELLARRGEPAA